ncbi:MAG: carotenoid 1,2-hydratase [Geminicoccaceae bacterium]|nr:MAG: carotenoid 1,2-hydratase [Geminicoccaceae bacterium]
MSDDGRSGLTLIALLGSVFSPYYAWSGRHDPLNHCALNVALYGAGGKRWAMTERRRTAVERTADRLRLGPSSLAWDGRTLTIDIDEVGAPIPWRIRGQVRLHTHVLTGHVETLHEAGGHQWSPMAPAARVEVELEKPARTWRGVGYLDGNWGNRPLEDDFVRWDWSRAALANDGAAILYDVTPRQGQGPSLGLRIAADGGVERFEPPMRHRLRTTGWRVIRETQSETAPRVVETLEDTPFYARSLVAGTLAGEQVTSVHESLSLDRFASNWVRVLLPFRMPRTLR